MLQYNYHTHTKWCRHASHTAEEMILKAISCGYKELGFSEHIGYLGENDAGLRLRGSEVEKYINEIDALKKKYENNIKIWCGFECEYISELHDYYANLLKNPRVDYLIYGGHFHTKNSSKTHFGNEVATKEEIELYAKILVQAINSKLFTYIAHPDWYTKNISSWNETCIKAAHLICKTAKENDMVLGFNVNGMVSQKRKIGNEIRYIYPYEPFWKIASEYQVKTIIECDAHTASTLDTPLIEEAKSWAKKLNLNIVEKVFIK